jgi:precorrin-6B methylase 2
VIIDKCVRPIRILSTKLFPKKILPDFRWKSYTSFDYEPQLRSFINTGQPLILSEELTKAVLSKNTGVQVDGVIDQHLLLYRTCLELKPEALLEIGAGAGYHMINLSKLLPDTEILGVDLLKSQVELGLKMFPEFASLISKIQIMDFSSASIDKTFADRPDIVFCQAVTMHVPYRTAKQIVKNMISVAKKEVLLVENITFTHNYSNLLDEIKREIGGFNYKIKTIQNNEFGMVRITKA